MATYCRTDNIQYQIRSNNFVYSFVDLYIAGQGVKMIVVSSGQLAGHSASKPVMMSLSGQGGVKTVSVRGGAGGNQILALPSGSMAGQTQTMMIGGKPVTVLTSGAAAGKTVQLVGGGMGGAGQMVVMQQGGPAPTASLAAEPGPVTSDAALAQLAAEAGLLEGGEVGGAGEAGVDLGAGQLDGGMVTPQEGGSEVGDYSAEQWGELGLELYSSQVDGDPGEVDTGETGETGDNTEQTVETGEGEEGGAGEQQEEQGVAEDSSVVAEQGVAPLLDHAGLATPATPATPATTGEGGLGTELGEAGPELDSESLLEAAEQESNTTQLEPEPIKQEEKPAVADQADFDGASALATLASAATMAQSPPPASSTGVKQEQAGQSGLVASVPSPAPAPAPGLVKSELDDLSPEERKREANWFDVGIIKGTSCTVSSYYLPNGDLEKSEIDVEVIYSDEVMNYE